MTIEELKNRLDNEKHLIDAYQEVVCGKKLMLLIYWVFIKKMG